MWDVIDLSRWQFALTALYHFLFVPLTLGLIFLLAIMETIYVVTGKTIYRDMTRFWGKLFGINFALGVATSLTMEFQFGTNWSLYSNYVGDIFGAPLAMEALLAFFLESTFVGLFFFGWQRLNKYQHLLVTWLVAFGSNISALWILNANGWMQYPTGAHFNIDTLRMEMSSFSELVFNPVSQVKFVHTVMSGYVTGAMFIMSISAWYLLRGRDREFALRSFAVGSVFGTLAILGTLQLGDSSAYEVAQLQPVKLAAMEGEWQTEPAPAPFHVIAWPLQAQERNAFSVKIPALLGILATGYEPCHARSIPGRAARRDPTRGACVLEFPHHGGMRFSAAAGDGDCVDPDLTHAYRSTSLGTAHDAVEPAAPLDCH